MFNPTKTHNVFLYLSNLIGYSRVVFCGLALFSFPRNTWAAFWFYGISCLLDAFDGSAARRYNQTSSFGAVLDMVTDRSTTSCLLVYLTVLYPDFTLFWQFLIALDLSSHYVQMYSSLYLHGGSHKTVDPKKSNWLLRQYYTNSKVLFFVCAGNELFYVGLFLLGNHFVIHPGRLPLVSRTAAAALTSPVSQFGAALQTVGLSFPVFQSVALLASPRSIIDIATSSANFGVIIKLTHALIAADFTKFLALIHSNCETLKLLSIISLIVFTSPIFLFKQVLNVIQLVGASRNLAQHDALTKYGKESTKEKKQDKKQDKKKAVPETPKDKKDTTPKGRSRSVKRTESVTRKKSSTRK